MTTRTTTAHHVAAQGAGGGSIGAGPSRWRLQPVPWRLLLAVAALGAVFALLPQIDLAASGWFAQGADGFPLQHDPWIGFINRKVLKVSRAASAVLLGLWLVSLWCRRGPGSARAGGKWSSCCWRWRSAQVCSSTP